jgi:hypothetical protein
MNRPDGWSVTGTRTFRGRHLEEPVGVFDTYEEAELQAELYHRSHLHTKAVTIEKHYREETND